MASPQYVHLTLVSSTPLYELAYTLFFFGHISAPYCSGAMSRIKIQFCGSVNKTLECAVVEVLHMYSHLDLINRGNACP